MSATASATSTSTTTTAPAATVAPTGSGASASYSSNAGSMAAAAGAAKDTATTAAGPRGATGARDWSEVCKRVQHSDGSVRTSPPFKSCGSSAGTLPNGASAPAASPPRPRPVHAHSSLGLRRINGNGLSAVGSTAQVSQNGRTPSRGGSSHGSLSGKSSRASSSSRDIARDGDISSQCSSVCWETSTNSSEPSRPRSPPDVAASPSLSKGLLMPDPIRTSLLLPQALLEDEPVLEGKADVIGVGEDSAKAVDAVTGVVTSPLDLGDCSTDTCGESLVNGALKVDPYGRDVPRRCEVKTAWSVEPMAKYLKSIVLKIVTNLQHNRLPTPAKLDTFVSKLVGNTQRNLKHAPKSVRHGLQAIFSKHFQKFWNFKRNEKVRTPTPEELKVTLLGLIETLADFAACTNGAANSAVPGSPGAVAQPKPMRYCAGLRV
eukprot:TRINITY_DN28819_c0_g1_i1.p1 TRINITY_DN28819_c0_g1~~TRINITY_DN28819_c0_g1_i1.p1  ORF type:complete len:433 (+),score=90.35 TRINITY_DN28819_c0_g1_i1:195-1493(+)